MTNAIVLIVVLLFGVYLVGFAVVSFVSPSFSRRFLEKFATSVSTHLLEQTFRLIIGTAFVLYSPSMLFAKLFEVFGWVLVISSLVLLVLPWCWHRNFSLWAVPFATHNLKLVASGSFIIGVTVISAVLLSPGAVG